MTQFPTKPIVVSGGPFRRIAADPHWRPTAHERLLLQPDVRPVAWAFEYVDHGRFIRRVGSEADMFAEAADAFLIVDMAWLVPIYRDQLDAMRPVARNIGFAYLETFKGNDNAKDDEGKGEAEQAPAA